MAELKPIGFKPDGSHINKGALVIIGLIFIGLYCIMADAPFAWLFGTPVIEVVKCTGQITHIPMMVVA